MDRLAIIELQCWGFPGVTNIISGTSSFVSVLPLQLRTEMKNQIAVFPDSAGNKQMSDLVVLVQFWKYRYCYPSHAGGGGGGGWANPPHVFRE